VLFALIACTETEPLHVDERDLDKAMSHGDRAALCAGLKMKDEDTRAAAAKHLSEFGGDSACLCERAKFDGRWDPPILEALKGVKKDEKVACLGTLLDDPTAPDRVALAKALYGIPAPALRARLKKAASDDADPKVRAYALAAYCDSKDPADAKMLADGLASNPDATWRASAATALTGRPEAKELLEKAVASDQEGTVRAAALAALKNTQGYAWTELGCKALLSDPAPEVRAEAALLFRATTDEKAIACLREAMFKVEPDGRVRASMLKTLRGTPAQPGADILCDAASFWIANYVRDAEPEREGDSDILFAQNDRDFERSLACVERALGNTAGWSCHGRAYASSWRYHLGGPRRDVNCN
jgi:HEAT repeats